MQTADRRPLASRQSRWAAGTQRLLLKTSITANQISLLGILFAALGAAALVAAFQRPWLFLLAALCIQLRLVCNLMDGLVAVEGGRGSATGALYNEVPDRLEDALLLAGFGCAAGHLWLGLVAGILAVFTAYVRAVGASHGFPQDFRGPMAKPQRMAALTLGCLLGLGEVLVWGTVYSLQVILAVVVLGSAFTGLRRLQTIAAGLEARR
jgi:phosphatidylglycerophosphate synthase